MHIAGLVTDEEAVSPVIGVILMVAVTVILSAVVGTFALGLGESQDTAPQATWEMKYTEGTSDTLELTHQSGDPMEADRLSVAVSGASADSGDPNGKTAMTTMGASGEVSAGTTVTLDDSATSTSELDLSGATVRVVWEDEDTDDQADSATLAVWEGPDA